MHVSTMNESKSRLLIGTIMVVTGVMLLIVYSGSPATKDAVAYNRICQKLKDLGRNGYADCQVTLGTLVEQLVDSKELDLNECKVDRTTVLCPVKVWYVTRDLFITSPAILKQVNQINNQSADLPVNVSKKNTGLEINYEPEFDSISRHSTPGRRKREVMVKKNEKVNFKNKNLCWDSEHGCCGWW